MPALARPNLEDPLGAVVISTAASLTGRSSGKKRVQVAFDPSARENRDAIQATAAAKKTEGFQVSRTGRKRKPKKFFDGTDTENEAHLFSEPKVVNTAKPKKKYASSTPKAGTKRKRTVLSPGISPRSATSNAPTTKIGMVEMKGNQVDVSKTQTTDSQVVPLRQAQTVGRRISIFWPLDEVWYTGTIRKVEVREEVVKHYVFYDDNQGEWVNLSKEQVRWDPEQQDQRERQQRRLVNSRVQRRGVLMGRKMSELASMKQQLQMMASAASLRCAKPFAMGSLTDSTEKSSATRAKAELNAVFGKLSPK
jgi:hypothetical protein